VEVTLEALQLCTSCVVVETNTEASRPSNTLKSERPLRRTQLLMYLPGFQGEVFKSFHLEKYFLDKVV